MGTVVRYPEDRVCNPLPGLTGKEEAGLQEGWVGCWQEQEALGHAYQLTRGDPCHGGVLRLPLQLLPRI